MSPSSRQKRCAVVFKATLCRVCLFFYPEMTSITYSVFSFFTSVNISCEVGGATRPYALVMSFTELSPESGQTLGKELFAMPPYRLEHYSQIWKGLIRSLLMLSITLYSLGQSFKNVFVFNDCCLHIGALIMSNCWFLTFLFDCSFIDWNFILLVFDVCCGQVALVNEILIPMGFYLAKWSLN